MKYTKHIMANRKIVAMTKAIDFGIVKNALCVFFLAMAIFLSGCASVAPKNDGYVAYKSARAYAKQLQMQGRYELAKEYYLIALSEASTYDEQKSIENDLRTIDMQIKSRR